MIDINRLYEQFNSVYNTHKTGFYRPFDFVTAVAAISIQYFNQMGGELPRRQKYVDLMQPFYKSAFIAITETRSGDIAVKPPDFVYYSDAGMMASQEAAEVWKDGKLDVRLESGQNIEDFYPTTIEYRRAPVTLVSRNRWSAAISHITRGPSKRNVLISAVDNGFEVQPKGVGVIALGYYRLPQAPVYNYTEREDGPDTYLDFKGEGSKHLEWDEAMLPAFLYKLGQYYNLTMKDELRLQVQAIDKDLV